MQSAPASATSAHQRAQLLELRFAFKDLTNSPLNLRTYRIQQKVLLTLLGRQIAAQTQRGRKANVIKNAAIQIVVEMSYSVRA